MRNAFFRKHKADLIGSFLLGSVLLLGGCVPGPMGKYYKPHMDAGTQQHYTGTVCQGQAGPPAVLHVTLASGVKVRIDTIRERMLTWPFGEVPKQGRPLHIALDIPRGTTVRFEGSTARVSEDGGKTWRSLRFHARVTADVAVPDGVRMADQAPTSTAMIESDHFRAQASLYYSLPKYVPQTFSMTVPAIDIAGGPMLSETRFDARAEPDPSSSDHGSLIYTTPESRALLKRRFAECEAEVKAGTKGLRCKNILEYDDGGFKRNVGPFSMRGRWYVFNVEGGSPFEGRLHLEYKYPLDWQFVGDALQLRDGQGETKSISLHGLTLFLRYGIPFDTAVRGVNDVEYGGDTKLGLETNLGHEEAWAYRVQLPPLLINGKPYRLPPIDLKKHVFEFGLWPFNC